MTDPLYHRWANAVFGVQPTPDMELYHYGLVSADGLEDVEMSGGAIDRGGRDGRGLAPLWAEQGGWVSVVEIYGDDPEDWAAKRDALRAATTPVLDRYEESPYDMVYGEEDVRTRFARVSRRMIPTDEQYLVRRQSEAQIAFTANDPFTYGPINDVELDNGEDAEFELWGWVPSKRWAWVVHGPSVQPQLTLAVDGFEDVTLRFDGFVPNGVDLVVESTPHSLTTTLGGVHCYGLFDGGDANRLAPFFPLPPGEQTITYAHASGTGNAEFAYRGAGL